MEQKLLDLFSDGKFDKLAKAQAKEYFQWYMDQIDVQLEELERILSGTGILMDFSVESLIPVWEWLEKQIRMVPRKEEDIQAEIAHRPAWMEPYVGREEFSLQTLEYAMDISIYFAEVVIRNTDGKIYWGYFDKPKNRMDVNEPVLLGFWKDMNLNPRRIIEVCMRRSLKEQKKDRLFDLYHVWLRKEE